jgi:hypothetical protein
MLPPAVAADIERNAHFSIEGMDADETRPPRLRAPRSAVRANLFTTFVDNAFDDKRVTIALISVWFCVCLGGFTWLGIFSSEYMRVGPSDTLTYMGMPIDSMARYLTVVGFVVISTAINDFASDAIGPWIQNTVMDHKSQTIPYSKFVIILITQIWSLYCGVMGVASIALVFAQFDLIMVRLVVDLFVNQYTMRRFLTNKSHDPFRYHNEFLNEDETDTLAEHSAAPETARPVQHAEPHKLQAAMKREAQEIDQRALHRNVALDPAADADDDQVASDDGDPALIAMHESTYQPSLASAGSKPRHNNNNNHNSKQHGSGGGGVGGGRKGARGAGGVV